MNIKKSLKTNNSLIINILLFVVPIIFNRLGYKRFSKVLLFWPAIWSKN
ncbi:MAG: hypothetical protein ACD_7C00154G0012 [uncultured bacterium]|nr:MAG: hypothetical protein ACD_7C00154G0012 [uncultured bacterium]